MPSDYALRIAIERRFPAALTPAPRRLHETAPTGIAEVDDLFDGGFPIGAISEVIGPECSGRTSLALGFVGQSTQQGHVCAWIDCDDTLDPESAAANGVLLKQLLWVRCSDSANQPRATKPWSRPWNLLDQAIRTTDLLLQAGGFAAIVLDLGSTAPEFARRIPLTTWFRFRQAANRTQCALVVLGREGYAQSSAEVVLECTCCSADTCNGTVLKGLTYEVRRRRAAKTGADLIPAGSRKPPASTWSASGAWDGTNRVAHRHDVSVRAYAVDDPRQNPAAEEKMRA
jgi:recombination protein RecA